MISTLLIAGWLAQAPVRVLFIGNSYTYYNDMPLTFAALAPAGKKAEVKAVTQGGASLGEMWHRPDVREALQEKWDFIVLQEQSTLGWATRDGQMIVNEPDYFWQSLRLFEPDVKRAGAQMVLYHTWSRKKTLESQAQLDYAYGVAATEFKARLAPVGRAWYELRQKRSEIELYADDGSHPSPAGSAVAACVLVQTIFDEPCLARDGEEILRAAAIRAVEEFRASPPVTRRPPAASVRAEPPKPTNAKPKFEGTWKGRVWMYGEPADFELNVDVDGEKCKGSWNVKAAKIVSNRPLETCQARADVLEFTVRDWFGAAVETHRVRMQGEKLSAQVNVGFRTPMRRANGAWQASRVGKP